ncbi:MAG TPA: hypothetical protein VKU38_12530 [Ktedonobacteraceae bacterium]|nr:hypothetical protein [Ktedonobacteraceae bacterium]
MNEQESGSNEYLRPPLWHGKIAFGKVALRLTLQKSETRQKSVERFRQVSLFELDEPFEQKSALICCRLLVLGLYLSFLACLTGLWLTGNSFGSPGQLLPGGIANFIASRPAIVLLVPLASLLGCYFLLRHITYDIIAWPERFLDERQKMVRDRAHRNAYKLVKVACLLIPLYLCLHAVFWTAQTPAPAPAQVPAPIPVLTYTVIPSSEYLFEVAPNTLLQSEQAIHINLGLQKAAGQTIIFYEIVSPQTGFSISNNGSGTIHTKRVIISFPYIWVNDPIYASYAIHTLASPSYEQTPTVMAPSWPNAPASMLLYYGVLLLSLLLMAIALPMSLVAWKERL